MYFKQFFQLWQYSDIMLIIPILHVNTMINMPKTNQMFSEFWDINQMFVHNFWNKLFCILYHNYIAGAKFNGRSVQLCSGPLKVYPGRPFDD